MPEGPEVKLLTTILAKNFTNRSLTKITPTSGRYKTRPPKNLRALNKVLPSKITQIQNHGKFIYINLQNGYSIWFTLGLTGTFFLNCAGKSKDERGIEVDKFCRIRLDTTSRPTGSPDHPSPKPFFFSDMRNFGTIAIHPPPTSNKLLNKKLNSLGPDPLQATTPTQQALQRKTFITRVQSFRTQSKPIGSLLLNQTVLAGVGNYIRAIALYRAKISPHRPLSSLTQKDLATLYNEIHKVETASYKKQSLSGLHTYPLTVYRKTKSPAGNPIKSDELPKGRHIYWDPKVQK